MLLLRYFDINNDDASDEKLSIHDPVDSLLSVEKRAQHQLDRSIIDIALLQNTVHKVLVVQLVVNDISSENARRVQVRQELESSSIVGVDISVENLPVK